MQKCRRCDGVLLEDVLKKAGVPLYVLPCIVCGAWVEPAVLPEPGRTGTTIFDAAATGAPLGRRRAP
jgi:hypothetical protein